MKHAYLIMAHTDFALLKTLIKMLDDERNDIYLHVDKKAKDFVPAMFSTSKAKLYILSNRLDVRWGHYSQIKLEMMLFETAHKNGPYTYYHLLSGMDLPLKSQDCIHNFFAENRGKEFVGFWHNKDEEAYNSIAKFHFFMWFERGANRYVQIILSKARRFLTKIIYNIFGPRKIDFICKKGYNWVSISHNFCTYLLSQKEWIKRHYKYSTWGDEAFMHTIIWNSEFRDNIYNSETPEGSMREIHFTTDIPFSYQPDKPYTYKSEDFDLLKNSSMIFARKFNSNVDSDIIKRIVDHANSQ